MTISPNSKPNPADPLSNPSSNGDLVPPDERPEPLPNEPPVVAEWTDVSPSRGCRQWKSATVLEGSAVPGVFGTHRGRRHAVWIEQPLLGGREIKQLENAKRATSAGSHRRFRPRRGGGRLVSVIVGVWFHELLFRSGFSHGESPLKSEGEAERLSGQALPQNAKADKREVSLCGRAQTRKEYWSAASRGGERSAEGG